MDFYTVFGQSIVHPIFLFICEYFISLILLYCALKYFGKIGALVFIVLSIQIANIQVLKTVPLLSSSMALGTILFTFSYVASDLLADVYGKKTALMGIWLGFFGTLMISIFMVMTLIYPVSHDPFSIQSHRAMVNLFTPIPGILVASFIAYLISQRLDVTVFIKLKERFPYGSLRGRFLVSTALSIFVDNVLFSALAWHYLSAHPLPWSVIWSTYVWETYVLRLILTVINVLFVQHLRTVLNR